MYRSRYTGVSYAEKFDSILHFFIPKEKVEEIRGKDRKADRGEPEASVTSFFLFIFLWGSASCSAKCSSGGIMWTKDGEKEAYQPAGTSLQEFAHRHNYSCEEVPVNKHLQRGLTRLGSLAGSCPQGQTYRHNYSCKEIPVGKYLQTCFSSTYATTFNALWIETKR
jgi:hypothetical protein